MNFYSFARRSRLCSRASRSPPRETRQTEEVQRQQAEQPPALEWQQQPEPHPAQENSPRAGSAKPRKNQRIKTNVLFCNIQRVCASVWVSVLCICLSVRKGTTFVSPRTGHTTRSPHLTTHKGRRFLEERRDRTNGGSAVPKPLVPAIIYPQWNMDIRGWDNTTTTTTTTQRLSHSRPNFVTSCTVHYICDVGSRLFGWYVL